MKDRWLNAGFDGEELQPYIEPERKLNETRIGNCDPYLVIVFMNIDWSVMNRAATA